MPIQPVNRRNFRNGEKSTDPMRLKQFEDKSYDSGKINSFSKTDTLLKNETRKFEISFRDDRE